MFIYFFYFYSYINNSFYFFSTSYLSYKGISQYVKGDNYNAKLKNYKSYIESYRDSNNKLRKKRLYIRYLEFSDKNNIKHTLESATRTGKIPVIDEKVKISYIQHEKTVLEHSYITYFLLSIGCFFAIIFGFLTQGLILYSLGKNMKNFFTLITNSLFKSVPVFLILFSIGLGFVIFNFFKGDELVSLNEVVITLIFLLAIISLLVKIYLIPKKE